MTYLLILVNFQLCKQAAISEEERSVGYVHVYKKMLFRRLDRHVNVYLAFCAAK